jgi:hypothetical protein
MSRLSCNVRSGREVVCKQVAIGIDVAIDVVMAGVERS